MAHEGVRTTRQSKKGELRTPAEEMDEIDMGGASDSTEVAQLGLRRHTSEKGRHAEALEFSGRGGGTSHRRNCRSKSGFAHFPDSHLS